MTVPRSLFDLYQGQIIDGQVLIEGSTASFTTTRFMVSIATEMQMIVRCKIFGKWVFAAPGDNPHLLYARYFPDMITYGHLCTMPGHVCY